MNGLTPIGTTELIGHTALVLLGVMTLVWLLSVRMRDASIVDLSWGPGFAVVGWTAWSVQPEADLKTGLGVILATVWGLRLGLYLAKRNLGHGEDFRYQSIRARVGPTFWWSSFFLVFGFQGALIWIISMPLQLAMLNPAPAASQAWVLAGLVCWAVGFFFEVVGDYQLAQFKADPASKGQVMDRGLWRYTRHPNYFGDALLWWGLYLLSVGEGAPLWTAFAPALMTFLLLRVSGVALLERTITERRPAYRDYIERTSAFIPWPPKAAQS